MNARRNPRNGLVALAAAFLLVLQSVLGAAAGPPVQRDIFGNVLCIGNTVDSGPMQHGNEHQPTCCMLGCASAAAGLPADETGLAAPLTALFAAPLPTIRPIVVATQRTPANPRAPPAAA